MTESVNPYASPTEDCSLVSEAEIDRGPIDGLYRDDKYLVLHRSAQLPNRCVLTGSPTRESRIRQRLIAPVNPWLLLLVLGGGVGILSLLICSVMFRKQHLLYVPLSSKAKSRRAARISIAWFVGIAAVAATCCCVAMMDLARNPNWVWVWLVVGIVVGVIAAAIAMLVGFANIVILQSPKMTQSHVWIRGVHPSILESLPPFVTQQDE